jgi:hypothetical protein
VAADVQNVMGTSLSGSGQGVCKCQDRVTAFC